MQKKLIALVVLLTFIIPAAAWAQVYTWTDSTGTVHYSDAPPAEGVKYSQLRVKSSGPTSASGTSHAQASSSASKPDTDRDATSNKKMADTPNNRKSLCKSLTSNISLLQGDQALNAPDANGKLHAMSKQDRKKQLDRAQAEYRQYCKH